MADLGDLVRGAPLGLLMFFGTYLAARRRKSGRAKSAVDYPALARAHGLEYRAPADGRLGSLRGEFEGFQIFVDPEERPRVIAYFIEDNPPKVALRTFVQEKRTPPGMDRLAFASARLNERFKDRYVSSDLADDLVENEGEIESALGAIENIAGDHLVHVSVTEERVEVALDYGKPPHVPAKDVEQLLPQVVAICRIIDGSAFLAKETQGDPAAPT